MCGKCVENSTDIQSESYWHQINHLGAWRLVTKEQVQKKYGFGGSRNYGRITEETEQKCVEKIFQTILENSTDIRSESYWHQINCLVEWWQVTKGQVKKYGLVVAGIMDKLRMNMMNGPKMCQTNFQKILEKSTNIRSESYWHQINHLVERWLVTKEKVPKKYGLAVTGIMDELQRF